MKKNLKICFISLLALTMFLMLLPTRAYAFEYPTRQLQISIERSKITPRAEETGYKYKIMNGKQYKRLWSYTYARWIDKNWTLV